MTTRVLNNYVLISSEINLPLVGHWLQTILFPLVALHITAIAVYKVEKIDYAYKFEVVDTLIF